MVRLYEIYDDEAAFQAHLETPHYARFKQATDPLIESRTIGRFERHRKTRPPERPAGTTKGEEQHGDAVAQGHVPQPDAQGRALRGGVRHARASATS